MFKVSFPAGTSSYYTSIAGRPASAYYTDEATLCEPPGVWWGAGAEALGLTGEVDADQAAAVFDRLLDPRGDGTTTLGRAPGRYRSAEHIEAEMLAAEPDATPERREIIRIEAGQKARTARTFIDATFSPVKSVSLLHIAAVREAQLADDARTKKRGPGYATRSRTPSGPPTKPDSSTCGTTAGTPAPATTAAPAAGGPTRTTSPSPRSSNTRPAPGTRVCTATT
jgi:hypothetical protein